MTATASSAPSNPSPSRRLGAVNSLSDQVWERLRSAIIYGDSLSRASAWLNWKSQSRWAPAKDRCARHWGVWNHEGLVERRARSGTFVTPISHDEMYELFAVRSPGGALRHSPRRLPTLTSHLVNYAKVDRMRDAADRDQWGELVEYDMGFHLRLCEWSDSHTLYQIWLPLYSQIQRFINQTHPLYFLDLHEIAETHQPLIDVLSAQRRRSRRKSHPGPCDDDLVEDATQSHESRPLSAMTER